MSRSAGTLITTNQATYIPPSLMPGYRGHCPTLKYTYGETYGNATAKYFQDYRSETLNSSKSQYCKGGNFPTIYSHNPDSVIGNRTRTRDRFLYEPKYELTNTDYDRQEELRKFNENAQAHRENYKDKSETIPSVDHFKIPVPAEDMFKPK